MTTVTTICTNEVGEYSAWRHVERHELEVYCRRSGEQFWCWIGRAYSHAEAEKLAEQHAASVRRAAQCPEGAIRMLTPEED